MRENFQKWTKVAGCDETHYELQTQMISDALAMPEHDLNQLLELMRMQGETAVYLSGTRLDSDFCFGSNDLGVAISVLPEDGAKAAVPGYHPGSTEVYVVFQGALVMQLLDQNRVYTQGCKQFDVVVIKPGQCHRVRNELTNKAASLIIKTNLGHKPGVVRCDDCAYYENSEQCSMHSSWLQEKEL